MQIPIQLTILVLSDVKSYVVMIPNAVTVICV